MTHTSRTVVAVDLDVAKILLQDRDTTGAGDCDAETAAASEILSRASGVLIVPAVRRALEDAGESADRLDHRIMLSDQDDAHVQGCAKRRAERYLEIYADPRDCRAVAEAECMEAAIFLTLNERLIAGLGGRTDRITISKPVDAPATLRAPSDLSGTG